MTGKCIGERNQYRYYSQNLEDLDRGRGDPGAAEVAPTADNGTLRGFLAKFLFSGEDVFKPVSALSGGEKGRLALAKLIYSQKNVLVLDEPTNHLDIPSRESLENALDEYDGTIITVSHDRFFLDKIANQMFRQKDGSVVSFEVTIPFPRLETEREESECRANRDFRPVDQR